MEEKLLPLLLFGGGGSLGPLGGLGQSLLPLLLFAGSGSRSFAGSGSGSCTGSGSGSCTESGSGSCTDASCCSTTESSTPLESLLANQLKRFKGCRVKLVLATSTLYPGGQLIIATIRDVQQDYILIDRIEVDGVPSVDPSFLLLSTEQIYAVQPITFKSFLFETLWRVQAFGSRRCTTL